MRGESQMIPAGTVNPHKGAAISLFCCKCWPWIQEQLCVGVSLHDIIEFYSMSAEPCREILFMSSYFQCPCLCTINKVTVFTKSIKWSIWGPAWHKICALVSGYWPWLFQDWQARQVGQAVNRQVITLQDQGGARQTCEDSEVWRLAEAAGPALMELTDW